jgi:hypothetical protein
MLCLGVEESSLRWKTSEGRGIGAENYVPALGLRIRSGAVKQSGKRIHVIRLLHGKE